jgi:serine/threonine protein kinase
MVTGQGHGKGVDWWTLGVLIFEMLTSYPPFYDEDPVVTYSKIARGKIAFPNHLSRNAVDLIRKLLNPKPTKRLGVISGGASLIKAHPWFQKFDWDGLIHKTLPAPFIPELDGPEDMHFFGDTSSLDSRLASFHGDSSSWDGDF